jgi:uncharacterized membrane protein
VLITSLVLVHVLTAFLYVAGYVAINVLTEAARRPGPLDRRRTILGLSGLFDRSFVRTGGTLVGLSGLALVIAGGRAWSEPWIWLSTLLYVAITVLGIFLWGPRGGRVEAAIAADDVATVDRLLNDPAFVALARIENIALLVVVSLMVLRPA